MATVDGYITLKDSTNTDFQVKARIYDDGTKVFYHFLDDRLPPGTDRSGNITTASTSQQVAAAQANRVRMTFQNTSDTDMYLTDTGITASVTSGYKVRPNVIVEIDTNQAVNVFCAASGKTFVASEMIRT